MYIQNADKAYIYNNNVQGDGYLTPSGSYALYSGTTYYTGNNISEDDDSPDGSQYDLIVSFVDEANNDFHLSPSDTFARNAGTNLSADTNLHFTDDAQGNQRYDAKWDIGALEGTTIIYRSVGNDTNNLLASTTMTVTIATTTAVFSADIPANIGVGDVLQYGASGYYALAFITYRTSSSSYEVAARDGTLPTATTSAPVSVFRAHEFLDDWEDQVVEDVNDGIDASVDQDVLIEYMDLTASNTAMFVVAYASTSADNLAVDIDGWTTATSSYIKIWTPTASAEAGTSQRHSGVWDNNKYRLSVNSVAALQINDDYARVEGLQIYSSDNYTVRNNTNSFGAMYCAYNIIQGNSSDNTHAMSIHAGNGTTTVYNNIIYASTGTGADGIFASSGQMVIYNNTIYGNTNGIEVSASVGNIEAKNNAVFGNADDFSGSFDIIAHNASDDGDGTNAISLGSSTIEWAKAFVDYENYDFRIRDTASVLYDSGTTIITVTDDILGNTRPYDDAYDVGAFEYTGGLSIGLMMGVLRLRGLLSLDKELQESA